MDSVLEALRNYQRTASPQKKAEDWAWLEKACQSTVNADQYISWALEQSLKPQEIIVEQLNFNSENPDYSLDFLLSA